MQRHLIPEIVNKKQRRDNQLRVVITNIFLAAEKNQLD
jgi:hypothetical protein